MNDDEPMFVLVWLCENHEKLAYKIINNIDENRPELCDINDCDNKAHSLCLLRVVK